MHLTLSASYTIRCQSGDLSVPACGLHNEGTLLLQDGNMKRHTDASVFGLGIIPGTRPVMSGSGYEFTQQDTHVQCKQLRATHFDTAHDALHDFYIRS